MKLYVAGIGPGHPGGMTEEVRKAIEECKVVAGYTVYTDLIKKIFPEKEFYSTPMRGEEERVLYAVKRAVNENVVLVCGGDCGVYAMAGLAYETAEEYPQVEVTPLAGVTAALSGAAALGSPLTADFAVISLSDLITPWEKIEKRLECAAACDICTVIYNPASKKRTEHLKRACGITLRHKPPETVCGYVRNIGREGQESRILTLGELTEERLDMFTTVFIGESGTRIINGKMVTPRGYGQKERG